MSQDLVITPLGDLKLSPIGDLELTADYNKSIVRRLSTTFAGYARFVRQPDGLVEIDSLYGSALYNFLANPMNEVSEETLIQVVEESLAEDPKVQVIEVRREVIAQNSLQLIVVYVDTESGNVNTAVIGE